MTDGQFYGAVLWQHFIAPMRHFTARVYWVGMHNEIFHFEIFKNFMQILKYFNTPSLKYFTKILIFITK